MEKMSTVPVALLSLLFLLPATLSSQCPKGSDIYTGHEEATFDVFYSWGPIWIKAGTARFEASRNRRDGKELLHLKASGRTHASYDWLYKVRDYYESWVDPDGFRPVWFTRNIYEDGQTLVNTLSFDPGIGKVRSDTKRQNGPVETVTLIPGPCGFDMLSSVYYFRTLDIASFPVNEKIPVTVIIDDSIFNIYVRYLGKETFISPEGVSYSCMKCATRMVSGTIFKGGEDVLVWVTDDSLKVPVYVEAKILIGTAKAYLKEYRGLNSEILKTGSKKVK